MDAEQHRLEEDARASGTGSAGARTSPSGSGARCARTTRRTAPAGTTSPTTTRAAAPIAGARTGCWASPTARAGCASRSRCGTGGTRSSRSGCSGSPVAQGNHGEDVKEVYYYLDATPTHRYMRALYKYPQAAFPYERLVEENAPPRQERAASSSWPTRACSTRAATSTCRWSMPRRHPTTSSSASRSPTAAPTRRACTCCRRCGSATLGAGGASERYCAPTRHRAGGRVGGARRACDARAASGSRRRPAPMASRADGCSPRTRRTSQRLYGGANHGPGVKDAFHDARRRRDTRRRRTTWATGTKAAFITRWTLAGRRVDDLRTAPHGRGRSTQQPLRPRLRAGVRPARPRGRRVLRRADPAALSDEERRVARQAYAGLLWSKQFYYYVVQGLARGGSRPAARRRPAQGRPQQRLAAPLQPRRAVDARQVGVSLVRGLGSGVPHGAVRAHRPGSSRKEPAAAVPARVVHAPQRPAARLRMGVRRRESARARLGRLARLQDDRRPRASATGRSSSACSRSCCSTSPGG